jgi:hypothetical protein
MPKKFLAAAVLSTVLRRVGRRSGVTDGDLRRALPGDELLPEPLFVVDRAAVIDAPPADVWPWLVQLGRERGGWYMPSWLEPLIVRRPEKKAATRIIPEFQDLAVRDDVADYGPGKPVFRVVYLDPPHVLVYLTMREPSRDWRWPEGEPSEDALVLSWALVLDSVGSSRSRLHLRLRATRETWRRRAPLVEPLFGLIDYLTIAAMIAGLRERLR